jgi:prevent-host-death family protein
MKSVKVTELRQNLPRYLAKVRRGERIRVTARGKAIAELTPPSATQAEIDAARRRLKASVVKYERPFDPVIEPGEWEANH